MTSNILTAGSANSELLLRIRSGLSYQMVSSHCKGVFPAYPSISAEDFPGYPFGIIKTSVDINTSDTMSGLRKCDCNAFISFYGTSSQTVNEAVDKAYRVLEDYNNKSGASALGVNGLKMNSTTLSTGFDGKKAIHNKNLNLNGWVITTV